VGTVGNQSLHWEEKKILANSRGLEAIINSRYEASNGWGGGTGEAITLIFRNNLKSALRTNRIATKETH